MDLDEARTLGQRLRMIRKRRGPALHDDVPPSADIGDSVMPPEITLPALRRVIDAARADDHAMGDRVEVSTLIAHARAAESVHGRIDRDLRPQLYAAIGEAYQLAGWMSFDQGRPTRAENLLSTSRTWAERAADPALAAFVLGPTLSFVATYGGNAALGVERAYGAMGWARRSGNRRLTAFTMTIGARARLGETTLCLDLLDQAQHELDRHVPEERDEGWLAVFDRAALDGHRGSCLLDLDMPDRAIAPLSEQDVSASSLFVRNRVIWQLDRVEALLRLGEIDQACTELLATTTIPAGSITPRVHRRFHAIDLRLRALLGTGAVAGVVVDAVERLRELTEAYG